MAAVALEFDVESTADLPDADPGDGLCAAPAPDEEVGVCTLRAAVMEANAIPGLVTVRLPEGVFLLGDAQGEGPGPVTLAVTDDLLVEGAGRDASVIDAQELGRVLRIGAPGQPAHVTLRGITLRGGRASDGGAVLHEAGSLWIEDARIEGSTAVGDIVESGRGGGVFIAEGDVVLLRSEIADNAALGSPEAADTGLGGGLYLSAGPLSDPSAGRTLALVESSVLDNQAVPGEGQERSGLGGGLFLAGGRTLLDASTIARNTAGGQILFATDGPGLGISGGGILNRRGDLTLVNSTVSENRIEPVSEAPEPFTFAGGGIASGFAFVRLFNATLADNDRFALFAPFDAAQTDLADYVLANTLITRSSDLAPEGEDFEARFDCFASGGRSLGFNFVSVGGDGCSFLDAEGDRVGFFDASLDAGLGPLADNGGPTLTHALLPGSPAIDAANPEGCLDDEGTLLELDQRGFPRPFVPSDEGEENGTQNGEAPAPRCDIGALEAQFIPEPGAAALGLATLATLLALARRRQRCEARPASGNPAQPRLA